MAAARDRRRARRVLRPDRCLRRPGRRARRGLPVDRAGARRRGRRRDTNGTGATMPPGRSPRRRPTTPTRADEGDEARRRGGRSPRVTMRLVTSELVDSREILPGQWLQSYPRPGAGARARAPASSSTSGPATTRASSSAGRSRSTPPIPRPGSITIHFRTIGRGTEWFTRLRPGDPIDMLGPLGRPFEVDPRSRHLLLDRRRPRDGRRPVCSPTRRSAMAAR